jgi:hypothetical protein
MQIAQFLSRRKRRVTSVAAACASQHKRSPNTRSQGVDRSIEGSGHASFTAMPISMLGPKLSCPGRVAPHPKLWTPKIGAKWEPAMSDDAGFQRLLNAFGLTPKADASTPEGPVPVGPSEGSTGWRTDREGLERIRPRARQARYSFAR